MAEAGSNADFVIVNIVLKEIANDCHHSGIFPSPGAGKIIIADPYLYIVYGDFDRRAVVLRYDGEQWLSGPRLPITPPYLALDSRGFLHVAGLHQQDRSQIWYFHSSQPYSPEDFDTGQPIHPRNYSSIAIDTQDDSLFYFGAGIYTRGIGFLRRSANGIWSERKVLGKGYLFYPGVVIRGGITHLMFGGWKTSAAVYENLFYMRSADGGRSWTRSDSTPITIPFTYDPADLKSVAALDRVTRSFREGHFESNTHNLQMLIDRRGRPHLLYYFVPAYFPRPQRFARSYVMHVRRDPDGWKHHLLADNPILDIGMAAIAEESNRRLHCLCTFRTRSRRYFDLGYCYSDDSGDHWSAIERVTADADARQLNYMYPHWGSKPFRGSLHFICSRGTGAGHPSPLIFGRLSIAGDRA